MAHTCSCCSDHAVALGARPPRPKPDAGRTVGDVLATNPDALAVMQRFGIDHCCGAGLTLAEAAAAAGADLDALLEALGRA